MTALAGHHTLRNRYRFEGRLELLSPLRLSSGRASDLTDAPLMRDRAETPYIPGSRLRGVLRSELERLIAGAGLQDGPRSCILFSEDKSPGACISVSRAKQEERRKKKEDEALGYLGEHLCDLCRLFGSPVYASRLSIEDACLVNPAGVAERSNVRDGVGIDRDTGAARENVKFNYEVLEKRDGTFFTFRMQVENLGEAGSHDATLLGLALALLEQGVFVGGKRSTGLGQIKLNRDSLKVRGFRDAQALWKALLERKDPHVKLPLEEVLHAETTAL